MSNASFGHDSFFSIYYSDLHLSHVPVGPGNEDVASRGKDDLDRVIPILLAAVFPQELPCVVI